jgi:hypothetical protein
LVLTKRGNFDCFVIFQRYSTISHERYLRIFLDLKIIFHSHEVEINLSTMSQRRCHLSCSFRPFVVQYGNYLATMSDFFSSSKGLFGCDMSDLFWRRMNESVAMSDYFSCKEQFYRFMSRLFSCSKGPFGRYISDFSRVVGDPFERYVYGHFGFYFRYMLIKLGSIWLLCQIDFSELYYVRSLLVY